MREHCIQIRPFGKIIVSTHDRLLAFGIMNILCNFSILHPHPELGHECVVTPKRPHFGVSPTDHRNPRASNAIAIFYLNVAPNDAKPPHVVCASKRPPINTFANFTTIAIRLGATFVLGIGPPTLKGPVA